MSAPLRSIFFKRKSFSSLTNFHLNYFHGLLFDLQQQKIKISMLSLLLISVLSQNIDAQDKLRTIQHRAFKAGEVLEYRVHYGFIDAGIAKLEIAPELKPIGTRQTYHVVGTGQTRGAFDWFFKVRDRYESFIDTKSISPWLFLRRIEEGNYKKSQNVTFNQVTNTASSQKATIATPENIQDLVSSYYYARTLDLQNAKPGDVFSFDAYLDDEVIPMKVKFVGKEKVKTKLGTFNCLKFHPQLLEGRVFKDKDDMTVWISDDENKVVIRAQAEILVGSVKMDLQDYRGLANEFSARLK